MADQCRVLVVDDERAIQLIMTEVLTDEGYEVRSAQDGREALEVLESWRPDVIVLDLMMPVMNGSAFRDAQRQLSDELSSIPIIVLSGARESRVQADALGAVATLPKPFDLDEVVAIVGRAVQGDGD